LGQAVKKGPNFGGGRCNVTHHIFEPRQFVKAYPRGAKELLSGFTVFQAKDTVRWFQDRGVRIVPESDGRMFPDSNRSETIINCFLAEASRLGVQILIDHPVSQIEKKDGKFSIVCKSAELNADRVLLATGSFPLGHRLAVGLGHTITELAPSLFSFVIRNELITGLEGISFPMAKTTLLCDGHVFAEAGPLLITHWGLSGPAVLKISAWSARHMKRAGYKATLKVNWLGLDNLEVAKKFVEDFKARNLKSKILNARPDVIPLRFWERILTYVGLPSDIKWAELSKRQHFTLAEALFSTEFKVDGKNRYKDEFVECGGVDLREVDFRTMQSKVCPGLYFAGEVLDIDGITGGFNFQNAWTGSWIGAQSMAAP